MVRSILWNGRKHYGTSSSWERHDHARRQSCNTAIHCPAGHCKTMSREGQASLAQLSKELGINPKTVAKWRKRSTVEDLKTGPRKPRSTVLTEAEEAMIVAFRRHTLLPMDDCLYALQPSIPDLSRSALHRCLQRHGISRLPDVEGDKPKRQQFKLLSHWLFPCRYSIGPDGGGKAISLCWHRPNQQVCSHPTRGKGGSQDSVGIP